MKIRLALIVAGILLLAGCSSTPGSYPIANGPLKPEEMAMASFGSTALSARVFDVVNQDTASAGNTGIAGTVQPTPTDILSSYAAAKFRANGGPYSVRFVIQQAKLTVHSLEAPKSSSWFSFDGDAKAEVSVDLSVMVAATRPDGTGATINATTSQGQRTGFGGTPEDHRAVYIALMNRAVQALDAEISRQLPSYFSSVIAR